MKKAFVLLVFTALIINACRKSENTFPDCGTTLNLNLNANDVFLFGSSGGFGGGGLGMYKMKNGQLFRVLANRDTLLSNDLFLQTKTLMTDFPKDLKDNPNQSLWGGCADTFTYFVEIQLENGTKQWWRLDACGLDNIPSALKCYMQEVARVSDILLKK